MRQVHLQPVFTDWQKAARTLLRERVPPGDVLWSDRAGPQSSLELFDGVGSHSEASGSPFRVPAKYIQFAKLAALHSSDEKWGLLYRVLWRLTHGGEPRLLEVPTDADVLALRHLTGEVKKDAYRMRAFLRFRKTRLDENPWFVAWYEPRHDTVGLNEGFFVGRYANMRWSILTPLRCMHWDGHEVRFSPGADKADAPAEDDVELLWVAYYSNIFNPARANRTAMEAQLLKRHWKNLPEAAVIEPLLRNAPRRTAEMIDRSDLLRERDSDYSLAEPPAGAGIEELREAAAGCRACPLWKTTTCTVFGEGPEAARIVLVGEQPGDQEDRAGRPFVGPAGKVLDAALERADVDRGKLYVTNAVKHFKFEPRGKRRIHQTPRTREIMSCRPWLEAELNVLKPDLIVTLGGTAAQSVFGRSVKVLEERGRILESGLGRTLVTIHPSALLRLQDKNDFEPQFDRLVDDLRRLREAS